MTDSLTSEPKQEVETKDTSEPASSYRDRYVGDGKKYADDETLAKSYAHMEAHAHTLEEELKDLREANKTLRENDGAVQEVLAELRKDSKFEDTSQANQTVVSDAAPTLTTEDVAQVVNSRLEAKAAEDARQTNKRISMEKLTSHYGSEESMKEALRKVIGSSQIIAETVDKLAWENPNELVTFVTKQVTTSDASVSNTPGANERPSADAVIAATGGGLTYTQCKEIRKKDPARYKSPEFRNAMAEMASKYQANGKDWFVT